jgi:hypothetical protein
MDPFLEDPEVFPDLHDALIIELRGELNSRLPAPYFAATAHRLWIETSRRSIWPDVSVQSSNGGPARESTSGGTAILLAHPETAVRVRLPRFERKETLLEVYRQGDGNRLVASVEILSPTNKAPGTEGRELYLRKQKELLERQVHLIEIDLLRGGAHTTAVPEEVAREQVGAFDYHVCVSPMTRRDEFFIYPMHLRSPLPEILIPLLGEDEPPRISLQALFDRAYDSGPYRKQLHYDGRPPPPPLAPEQTDWMQRVLREKGVVSSTEKGPS